MVCVGRVIAFMTQFGAASLVSAIALEWRAIILLVIQRVVNVHASRHTKGLGATSVLRVSMVTHSAGRAIVTLGE